MRIGKMQIGTKRTDAETNINQITEGVIWKQLLAFFFPILFGTFFQQLYNTTDAIVVGNFVGKQALAAVGGPASTLINLLVGFFTGLSSGATVVISQFYGAKHKDDVRKAVHTSIALSIAGGAVIMVLGIAFAGVALRAMNTPEDIMSMSLTYMRIYFLGVIPSLIYNMGSGILRAVGDSKRPLYFLIASTLTNIVLDLFFVLVLRMGVAGVAIATSLSQVASAAMVMYALMKTDDMYRLYLREIRFSPSILSAIIRIGLPAGLQSTMYSVSNLIIQASINSFGTDTIAAWAVFGKIDGLFWMTMDAMGIAITTFAGQNFGADKLDRVKRGNYVGLLMSAILTAILGGVVTILGPILSGLFTSDATVLEYSLNIIHFLVPFWFTYVCVNVFPSTLRGVGDALVPMLLVCIGTCVLRVTWIFTVGTFVHDLMVTLVSYPLSWSVTSIAFLIYYYRFSAIHKLTKLQKRSAK